MPDRRADIDGATAVLDPPAGREASDDRAWARAARRPEALANLLHDDLGADSLDGDAWLLIEEALHEHGQLERDRVHDAIQEAFGWYDDHLYSFWLDSGFFGSDEVELTTPDAPDEGVATADVPLGELDLHLGQRLGYVFDFGDEWRVRLTVRERVAAAEPGDHPRLLELRGTPPPQYAALDD
jgi:hypothetical protein